MSSKWFRLAATMSLLTGGLVGAGILQAGPAAAAAARLHVLQFNACDQYQAPTNSTPACKNTTSAARAAEIVRQIQSFDAQVVTLQEICFSTFYSISQQLPGWSGYHYGTVSVPDSRCGLGQSRSWGIAILTNGSTATAQSATILPTTSGAEERAWLCANTTIGAGFRFCSTHLTSGDDALTEAQVLEVARQSNGWVTRGAAILTGGDLNIDALSCPLQLPRDLGALYTYNYAPPGQYCSTQRGNMYEADAPNTSTGDGTYNEGTFNTFGSPKYDYVFFNRQRFQTNYGGDAFSSSVSDHKTYRSAMTVY